MDAVKFLEEANKMCESYSCCADCPANTPGDFDNCRVDTLQAFDAADAVAIVEKWSKEHSRRDTLELRSCPFCGSRPIREYLLDGKEYIICSNANCPCQPMTAVYKSNGAAARAWNRRATK